MDAELQLSEAQRRAVDHDEGHLRIIACPGSGKTETVSRRVAELIKKGAEPSKIVAFTFTEKAAEGLKFRIRGILERECSEKSDFGDMYIGTIDSFCLYMLKRIKPEYRSYEILDSARRTAFVDRWYRHMGLDELQTETQGKWRTIRRFCSSLDVAMTERVDAADVRNRAFGKCYGRYVETLHSEKFFDFVSIIRTLLDTLEDEPESLRRVNDEVKHVVFDEYQDVNMLQEELLEYLSRGAESVCVVGDDDQNIFQWRGSNIDHILEFESKYSEHDAKTVDLQTNYRSTGALIQMAARFIEHNGRRVSKEMRASAGQPNTFEEGDMVHHHFETDAAEFGYVRDTINSLRGTAFKDKRGGTYPLSYGDMAVLVRTNDDAARVSKFMSDHGVPWIADSGASIFDRPIVSLAADCLFYAFGHPGYLDNEVPDLDRLIDRYSGAVRGGDAEAFRAGLESVKKRAEAISAKGQRDWLPNLGLQEFYQRILSAMGAERGGFSDADMYNLAVLSRVISDYEYVYRSLRARQVAGLKWFIVQFAQGGYADPAHEDAGPVDAVRILTIWKAKGLEFPVVFVPSFSRRNRPPQQSLFIGEDEYESGRYAGGEEDDRRAYYVAITRSMKYLFLTSASKITISGNQKPPKTPRVPHPFAGEMECGELGPAAPISRPVLEGEARSEPGRLLPTSYSELSMYDRCPHDYKLRHVMGFHAGVPAAFGYGTNIHNILNHIHEDFIQRRIVPSDGQIDEMFDRMFHMRFAPGAQNDNMRRAGIRVVKNYVQLHGKDFGRILDTEKRFEFQLNDALVSGSIDLLKKVDKNGNVKDIEIIDFKTDRRDAEGRYELDHSEQVKFYAYAVRSSLGHEPEGATVHYLDTQETRRVDISPGELEDTRNGIIAKIGMIKSGRFEPTPEDKKCRGCDFRALCQHKGFELGPDFSPVRAERRKNGTARADADPPEEGLGPSVVSAGMRKKAEKLASGGVRSNGNGTYSVASSTTPGDGYTVSTTGCECRGFREYGLRNPGTKPTCSHIIAVGMFIEKSRKA